MFSHSLRTSSGAAVANLWDLGLATAVLQNECDTTSLLLAGMETHGHT